MGMNDKFDLAVSDRYEAIAPSDTVDYDKPARGLYLGTGGDVAVVRTDDTVVTFPNMVGGLIHGLVFKRINATGTTASGVVVHF
jgi:hypothetical protein